MFSIVYHVRTSSSKDSRLPPEVGEAPTRTQAAIYCLQWHGIGSVAEWPWKMGKTAKKGGHGDSQSREGRLDVETG